MSISLVQQLHELLVERFSAIGFATLGRLTYVREVTPDCSQLIAVAARRESAKLRFTCILKLRFKSIESMLRPDADDESYSTASCPIHLLRRERGFYDWEGGDSEELTIAADSLVAEVIAVGLPFLDRFSDVREVKEELSASSVSEYFTLSPHQQASTLAAIHLAQGERAEAESVLTRALDDPRNQHPGRKRRLQEVQERLLGK